MIKCAMRLNAVSRKCARTSHTVLHPLGERKDLPGIEPDTLTASYQEWLDEASMDLYVVGDTTLEEVENLVRASFQL